MTSKVEVFIDKFVAELRQNNAAVFVGAGLSTSAGFVDWAGLLTPLAKEIGLDSTKETDMVALAQYYLNAKRGQRSQINQLLVEKFADVRTPTENHRILARLPLSIYWTTNYDRLIEDAIQQAGRRLDVKHTVKGLSRTRPGRDAVLYKMHGDIELPEDTILAKDEYEKYHVSHQPFVTALSGDLVERTFLFLGFSFTDPNIDYIFSRIRIQLVGNQRTHYWLTKRRTQKPGESSEDFGYAKAKQDHVIEDLKRFNVEAILVDEYSDITEVLRKIENRFRRATVFVSGAAADYSGNDPTVVDQVLKKIGTILIADGFRIASGMGIAVGTAVVTGAIEQIYSDDALSIQNSLVLRPFPIGIEDAVKRMETFTRYREELISQAGIAIFILGNKTEGGKLVESPGVWQEFELAKKKGLHIVPVGGLGGMAAKVANEVLANFAQYYPKDDGAIRGAIEKLNGPVGDGLGYIEALRAIINKLAKE